MNLKVLHAYATLSPTLKFLTLDPVSLITPAPSRPNPDGSFKG